MAFHVHKHSQISREIFKVNMISVCLSTNLRKGEKPEIAANASRKKYRYQQNVERKRWNIVARLGKASILSDFLYEIYRYYEIFGEEQYELHTRWLWRRLWKGIISLSS